ncbi:DgyrCDS11915 [Dimorphilus gyrociliatus]|uniref:DgyrCDS11915 n=1 Tax=Dimorphilus gyrociliatus TaxID=2664684 RepID=A0A7I8W8D7_9ANNE|nr:DgyrCDS11915 [Dimorphilus gyrociliatus]
MNSAAIPTPVEDIHGDGRWMSMHQRFVGQVKEKEPEILFIGDSLISQMALTDLWQKMFVPLHCLNFGIDEDRTENVLWRISNGELECISPKVIILLVGTNNYDNSAEEISEAILAIVDVVQGKQPQSQLIVMGIPPRGENPNRVRDKIEKLNSLLKLKLEKLDQVTFLQVDTSMFVNSSDGTIDPSDMYDYLHFTTKGYQKLTEPLLDEINNLLMSFERTDSMDAPDDL